jgi:hypothetical protein
MKQSQKLVIVGLFVSLSYAIGLTYVIGLSTITHRFNKKITFPIIHAVLGAPNDISEYVEKPCPRDEAFGIAYFGQSNSTNTVEPLADLPIPSNLLQYDWKSSKCFAYKEPLLGADFTRGNSITYAAVRIARESVNPVVVIPFGFGPSTILEWGYGEGAYQHRIVLDKLKESRLSPKVFLWHQGESDVPFAGVDESVLSEVPYFNRPDRPFTDNAIHRVGIAGSVYENALRDIVSTTLRAFPESHFGIALVSHAPCLGSNEIWEPIRDAQKAVATSNLRTFISADSDQIRGQADRYDGCHFSDVGAKKLSEEYYRSISSLGIF